MRAVLLCLTALWLLAPARHSVSERSGSIERLDEGVDFCSLKGAVYVEEVESFANFKVYVEDVESFADLIVFKEQARAFADRPGLWHFTDVRAFADYSVAFTPTKAFADFSVYFSEFKSLAGCRR